MRLPQPLTMGQWFADDWIDSPIYVSQVSVHWSSAEMTRDSWWFLTSLIYRASLIWRKSTVALRRHANDCRLSHLPRQLAPLRFRTST